MGVIRFKGNKLDPKSLDALVAATLVEGSATSKWWRRQSTDFLESFMDTIRTSMQNGESLQQAVTRIVGGTVDGVVIPGILKTARNKASALAATSINAVSNRAALETFQANTDVIKWITQVSTLDNRTSDVCIAYSGKTWDVNTLAPIDTGAGELPFNGGPPRHFNCRSRLRPVTKSFEELGFDLPEIPASTRASMDGQVPADITFGDWLRGKTATFQNNLLGTKRAELWRNGNITLTQLVDMRGNPMTIRQLEARAGLGPAPPVKPVINQPAKVIKLQDRFVELDVPDEGLKTFVPERVDKKEVIVLVDRNVLEDGWKRDAGGYIPPDLSKNTIGKRIDNFEDFLKDEPIIEVGNVSVRENGLIAFGNGRHRSRVLLNKGMDKIPLAMSEESFQNLSKSAPFSIRKASGKEARERLAILQEQARQRRIERFKRQKAERERRKAQEAKEKAEREAREAKTRAEIAEREAKAASPLPDDVPTIVGDDTRAGQAAKEFLIRNGFTEAQLADFGPPFDLLTNFNPTIAGNMLRLTREKIAAAAARVTALKKATAELPDRVPEFKTSREAMEWTKAHMINPLNNNSVRNHIANKGGRVKQKWNRQTREWEVVATYDELVAWQNYDKKFFRVVNEVTLLMSKRFNMRLPNFIGLKQKHPQFNFKGKGELAAVHMESDSLLLPGTITNKKKVLERSNWQEQSNQNRWLKGETRLATMLDDAKELKKRGLAHADALIEAIQDAIKNKDFPFTVTSIRGNAFNRLSDAQKQAMYIWDTIIHESGHRLHGQFRQRVDAVLDTLFKFKDIDTGKNRFLWARQVSEYATENPKEFLAESFTRYMLGDHKRVYPPLLDLFKELDNATDFGIDDISDLFTEFAG